MIKIERRNETSNLIYFLTPVLAIFLTLVTGAIIFYLLSFKPLEALKFFFITPISDLYGLSELLVKATPLCLIAIGLSFCFKINNWNIGAEGQLVFGAIFSGWLALNFLESNSFLLLPCMMLVAILGGMFWALIPAILKIRFNTNEILVSLMLTYVASLFIDFLVRGPWRDPMSFGFPLTPTYSDAALIDRVYIPFVGYIGQLHYGVFVALFVSVILWIIFLSTEIF